MGGISESGFVIRQGAGEDGGPAGVFAGRVTSQNNGGFASVRTRNLEPPLDLGAFEGLQLRVKGDGMRYKLIIRCDAGWDSVGYTQGFNTQPGEQIRKTTSDGLAGCAVSVGAFLPLCTLARCPGTPPCGTTPPAGNSCSLAHWPATLPLCCFCPAT